MPGLPIPDDWSGNDWECFTIKWPKSTKWIGILAGLLTTMHRGRTWDERTGSIASVQEIGWQIFDVNVPFTLCSGSNDSDSGEKQTITPAMVNLEELITMSLCGYNPKAFKIDNGVLYVRDFCGDWVAIGAIAGGEPLPDTIVIPDPLPNNLTNATACSKVSKLATTVYNIVVNGWDQLGVTSELVDLGDFISDMRDIIPGIDLDYGELVNIYFSLAAINVGGYENESMDITAIDYLKCNWVDLVAANNEGITSAEYNAIIDATDAALRPLWGKGSMLGFGDQIRRLWLQALRSIGPDDVRKLTTLAQSTGLETCDCPEEQTGPTPIVPSNDGWYFGDPINVVLSGSSQINLPIRELVDHHVYGVKFTYLVTPSASRVKRAGGCTNPALTYDFCMNLATSDFLNTIGNQTYYQWATSAHDALVAEGYITAGTVLQNGGWQSSVVGSPVATAGQVVYWILIAETSQQITFDVTAQWIHNVNDGTH